MPERSSTPLESPRLVGDPISADGSRAGGEADEGPSGAGGADRDNSVARPLPVLPVLPTAPPRPTEAVDLSTVGLDAEGAEGRGRGGWRSLVFSREANSWLVSLLVHCSVLLILGLIATAVRPGTAGTNLMAHMSGDEPLEELDWEIPMPDSLPVVAERGQIEQQAAAPELSLPSEELIEPDRLLGTGIGLHPSAAELSPHADAPVGGGLEGRSAQGRARLLAEGGGTPGSESAVDRGLRWLYNYQREDGSWNFDHNKGRNSGFCRNPGSVASTTGATAIALAPFLGRGHTHLEGEYQDTVHNGLYYLKSRALLTPNGIDLQEGTMYAQGLAAIVLSEGYALTGDPGLKDVAQGALDFIEYAQDKEGGGWRYTPGQPGDTTVTGWQLMALKSGQMANLHVHSPDFYLACNFLDSVSSEDGARYGYLPGDLRKRKTTTAIGLLLRMYTGWRRSNPALANGVDYLSKQGPSKDSMYYNYYATQVMRHWGGREWERWNPEMRDYLVATQSNHGHEAGSWYFSGGHGSSGGRLYNTAMAVMTLEVYYRHMPLYRQKAFEE